MFTLYDLWVRWIISLPSSVKSEPSVSVLGALKRKGLDAAAASSATSSTWNCT